MQCIFIVQPAGVMVRVMWQLGRDTCYVLSGLEYPRGGRLEMDLEGHFASFLLFNKIGRTCE